MLAQNVLKFRPDIVWAHHGRAASNPDFLGELRRHGVKTAVYLCDEPYETGETARYSPAFDFVFSMDPCTVEAHRKSRAGRSSTVYYLPPGVDVSHFNLRPYFDEKGNLVRGTSCFFLGNASLIPRKKWLEPIDRLIDGADIRFFKATGKGHPQWVPAQKHPEFYGGCVVGLNVHRHPGITADCFKKRVLARSSRRDPPPKGLKLCERMPAQEGTGFWNDANLPAAHVNPRFMEMAACGTLVVSDNHRSELARMFPMAPRASNPEHFYELVRYYLDNPEEAEHIGRTCSYLISKRHTYQHRAAEALIRVGFKVPGLDAPPTYWGEPEDWLTPQDCSERGIKSFSDPIGPSERWSPAFGMSSTRPFGNPNAPPSLDVPTPYLS